MASVVSREAYFETGLDVLSDLGYDGLKLAEVCSRLGSRRCQTVTSAADFEALGVKILAQ
jgi:hypothetical protein